MTLAREIVDGAFFSLSVINLFDEKYAKRADYAFGNARYFPAKRGILTLVSKKPFS